MTTELGRGRDAGCLAPLARIRTRRITSYGSYLGLVMISRTPNNPMPRFTRHVAMTGA
jgi:hypothetical protein